MKKIILNTLLAIILFGGAVAYAETDVSSTTRRDVKPNQGLIQRIRGVFENQKELKMEDRRETRLASSTEKKMEKRFEKMSKKYLATIEREGAIMAKIVLRIEKIKALNGNTVEAEKLVAEAKTKLEEAKTAYEALKTLTINADTAEELTREALEGMKNSTKSIEGLLREAHKLLEKSIGSLRGVSQLRNASSTKER